jgi:hypothetical protein
VKVLSVKQPWAWAIAMGHKTVENRSRATSHRGPLAIHSSKQWDEPEDLWLRNAVSIARNTGRPLPNYLKQDMPYIDTGLILAVVDVVSVCTASRDDWPERCECGPWANPAETHWKLTNARLLLEPIPAKGRLGLWEHDVPLNFRCGAIGFWGANNTRYVCELPAGHGKHHENNAEAPGVIWFGDHMPPCSCGRCPEVRVGVAS